MKHFNGIVGALSGWFLLASVLIGAALGALGFAFGPAGVATVGAGASAGLAFAEEVGLGLGDGDRYRSCRNHESLF